MFRFGTLYNLDILVHGSSVGTKCSMLRSKYHNVTCGWLTDNTNWVIGPWNICNAHMVAAVYPRCIYCSCCGSLWWSAWGSSVLWYFEITFSVSLHWNSNLVILPSAVLYRKYELMQQISIKWQKCFWYPFFSAVAAYQLSINYSHHRIIVNEYFGFLDVLVSNPSLDQYFVMSGIRKTEISFLSFLFMIINVSLYIATCSPFSILPCSFCQAVPILMQCSHGVSLFVV
jgi:hypothetical protein